MTLSAEHHLQGLRGIILCFPTLLSILCLLSYSTLYTVLAFLFYSLYCACFPILLSILCFPILLSIFLSVCCVLSVLSCLVLSCLSRFTCIDTVLPSALLVSHTPLNPNLSFSYSFLFPPHSCLHLSSSIPLPHTSFSPPPLSPNLLPSTLLPSTTPFRSVVQLRNAIGITVDSKVLGPSDSRFPFFSFFISSGFSFLPSLHSLSPLLPLPFPSPPLSSTPLPRSPSLLYPALPLYSPLGPTCWIYPKSCLHGPC